MKITIEFSTDTFRDFAAETARVLRILSNRIEAGDVGERELFERVTLYGRQRETIGEASGSYEHD